jgi:hypothetical protein
VILEDLEIVVPRGDKGVSLRGGLASWFLIDQWFGSHDPLYKLRGGIFCCEV